jgi:hypothetical protein
MSYTITKTDGTTLGTILDGTINTSFTSLTLIGRNYANYGQLIANDLVALLENFAYSSEPANPLAGQLYWNTTDKRLRVYTGTAFKIVSSCTAQTTAPTTTVAGDLWWDTTYSQLYIYNGTDPYSAAGWILVGPQRDGSGAVWEQIVDNAATPVTHDVLSIKLNNARTSIISRDSEFTPANAIAGFTTIKAGINANTSIGSATFHGLANNSSFLGGQPAASYLRNDIDATTTGNLTIAKNGGLTIGLSSNLQITTDTNGDINIKNTKSNGDINFYSNVSGTNTLSFGIDGATGTAALLSATLSGSLTLASGATVTGALNVTGTGAFSGNLTAPTQLAGTADTTVATTAFVVNNSGFLTNKIYAPGITPSASTTYIAVNDTGTGNAEIVMDGTTVATASASGFNLLATGTATTQTVSTPTAYHQYYANLSVIGATAGNALVATTGYVSKATQYWSGSAKFVSTAEPDNAVGKDGDFWFQREA